ncbi:juvenile hormone esterase-like [Leptopilina boulardi]|uniref:juvenile hormone esterase-like n=1 Tax=Leptopilina boulardi TaxID=63433 RepID=UPI0021F674DF|nr:juvenile hormone esterase-like [Leptopilina boulardi]
MWQLKFMTVLLIVIGGECVPPSVETQFGNIRGQFEFTEKLEFNETEKGIEAYLGIPYAEPPIKELRFKDPVKWTKNYTNSELVADKDKPHCIQIDYNGAITGEEDCLYMNIFVPKEKKINSTFPVLIFIRGGSFNMGSTNSEAFSPKYLLRQDVILVTFNYRLNFLGFYSTGNEHAQGNYGLKDMVQVLNWVKENIHKFNGNPNSVTLFGNSAGAAAIHHLALSKNTKGLFHKIITMSGSALAPWAYHTNDNIRNSSLKLANYAGCYNISTNKDEKINETNILTCMREKNVTELLKLTQKFAIWKNSPNCIFGPTLEKDSKTAVIIKSPKQSIEDGDIHIDSWIMGVTSDEGLGLVNLNENDYAFLKENFTKIGSEILEYSEVIKNKTNFTKSIVDYYFQGNITANITTNFTKMIGDAGIYWPVYNSLKHHFEKLKIYFYHFAYEGTFSILGSVNHPHGVAHIDDVGSLFPFLEKMGDNKNLQKNDNDKTMINLMTELFSNFAKNGVPHADLTTEWKPYKKENTKFMRIGDKNTTKIEMENDFLVERMQFWELIMKNTSHPDKKPNGASFNGNNTFLTCLLLTCLGLFSYYL